MSQRPDPDETADDLPMQHLKVALGERLSSLLRGNAVVQAFDWAELPRDGISMSITALVTGRLLADPEQRTVPNIKSFTLARLAAPTEDGDARLSVIAFGMAGEELVAMHKGDTVALTGRAKVKPWVGRDGATKAGLSLTADAVMTAYGLRKKRAAIEAAGASVHRHQPERDELAGGAAAWPESGDL